MRKCRKKRKSDYSIIDLTAEIIEIVLYLLIELID